MIYGSQIKFMNTFSNSQTSETGKQKAKCEVIIKSGDAGSEQALMVLVKTILWDFRVLSVNLLDITTS